MAGSYRLIERPLLRQVSAEAQWQSPQGVLDTNEDGDPSTIGEAESELTDGYPFHYDCSRGVNEPLTQLVVEFDYEYVESSGTLTEHDAFYNVDALPPALPAMEWGLLWTVAYDLGLHGCQVLQQTPESRRLSDASIVSLSSRPIDSLDPSVSSCQFLIDLPQNQTCHPMRGVLMAHFLGSSNYNDSQAVRDTLLHIVQSELDEQKALTGGVVQTLYLGSRSDYASRNPVVTDGGGTQPQAASFTGIVVGIVVAAIAFLVAALLLVRGRRHSEEGKKKVPKVNTDAVDIEGAEASESSFDVVAADHVETASTTERSVGTVTAKSIGSSTTILMANKALKDDDHVPDALSIISTASTDDSAGSEGAVRTVPLTPTRTDFDYTPTTKILENLPPPVPSTRIVDNLPPLPPSGPSSKPPPPAVAAAIANTRRRRKKKKRKKAKLARVSSRENIKGMETIAEIEEVNADDDDDDDDGSEYSWSTSDTDGSRSRDPSPSRSESTPEISSAPSSDSIPASHGPTPTNCPSPRTGRPQSPRPPRSPTAPSVDKLVFRGHEC